MKAPIVNVAITAAHRAGRIIHRSLGRIAGLTVTEKQRHDFVSEVDRQAEAEIIREIRRLHPDHAILAEESGAQGDHRVRWIIDPLDGTTNFLRGIPHYAVSIGIEVDGKLEHAVVYDAARDELFRASKGQGSYVNDRRMRVNGRGLDGALLGYALPFRDRKSQPGFQKMMDALFEQASDVRRMGAASLDLAYVAAGRLDGYIELGLQPWDLAGGTLLVREAGGSVSDLSGGDSFMESGNVVAGGVKLTIEMLAKIRPYAIGALRR